MLNRRHAAMLKFHGDPNLGLYAKATDKYCIVGRSVPEKVIEELKEVLDVPIIKASIYGTDLVGLFCSGNSSVLLVPEIAYENELTLLSKEMKKLGVAIKMLATEHTAFGNNLLVNDKVGIVGKVFDKAGLEMVKKAFPKVKFLHLDLSDTSLPGSAGVLTNKGAILSPNTTDKEITKIEKLFGFEIGLGTINMGNPFVSSGIIANSNGFAVGESSSGYEVARVDESLGFLN